MFQTTLETLRQIAADASNRPDDVDIDDLAERICLTLVPYYAADSGGDAAINAELARIVEANPRVVNTITRFVDERAL